MEYFQILVHGGTPEELAKRILDNEKRGFKVARYFNRETERVMNSANPSYLDSEGVNKRYRVSMVNRKYGAVMRRQNRDAR